MGEAEKEAAAVSTIPREDIRAILVRRAEAITPESVELTNGDVVYVKDIGGNGLTEYEKARLTATQAEGGQMTLRFGGLSTLLARLGVCDATGKRVFNDSVGDRKVIAGLASADLRKIAEAVAEISHLAATDEEDEKRQGESEASEEA